MNAGHFTYSSEPPEPELYTEKLERRASKHFKLRGCYLKYQFKMTPSIKQTLQKKTCKNCMN